MNVLSNSGGGCSDSVNLTPVRTFKAVVRVHKEKQFPVTILNEEGFNLAELPLCKNSKYLFDLSGEDGEEKTVEVSCRVI